MRLNIFLLIAFVVSVAANFAIRHDPSKPNAEYLPEMVRTAAYDSFAPNPNFPDGKTLQPPPEGTIPRGAKLTTEEQNPFAVTDTAVFERGQFVFQTFCVVCHGPAGKGDGTVVARGYPAPPPLMAEHAMSLKDGEIFQILSRGQKNMPSYASHISHEDLLNVILYVRSMQKVGQK